MCMAIWLGRDLASKEIVDNCTKRKPETDAVWESVRV